MNFSLYTPVYTHLLKFWLKLVCFLDFFSITIMHTFSLVDLLPKLLHWYEMSLLSATEFLQELLCESNKLLPPQSSQNHHQHGFEDFSGPLQDPLCSPSFHVVGVSMKTEINHKLTLRNAPTHAIPTSIWTHRHSETKMHSNLITQTWTAWNIWEY